MKIGIDISQAVFEGTGVARYVTQLTQEIIRISKGHTIILFGSSWGLRKQLQHIAQSLAAGHPNVKIITLPLPLPLLDIIWNRLHIAPIEWITGTLDVFWSSDWVQPPLSHAVGMTTIHDVSFLKFPESFDTSIREVHGRRLKQAAKNCRIFLCDSEATKQDVITQLHIDPNKLHIVYPGYSPQ